VPRSPNRPGVGRTFRNASLRWHRGYVARSGFDHSASLRLGHRPLTFRPPKHSYATEKRRQSPRGMIPLQLQRLFSGTVVGTHRPVSAHPGGGTMLDSVPPTQRAPPTPLSRLERRCSGLPSETHAVPAARRTATAREDRPRFQTRVIAAS
jgi:hypothetical protein